MSKQFYLFDLDGTLTDPKIGITKSVQYALAAFGIEVTDLDSLNKFIGPPLYDALIEYYGFSEADARKGIEKYRERFASVGLYENFLYDGMTNLLKSLTAKEKTLIVATSKPGVYSEKILEHFDIRKYFSFVAGSEFDGTRTKKGDVISYALESMDIKDLSACVMIGDRKHDVIGAKENGIECVGALYGYSEPGELENAGADYISKNVNELESLLLSLA